MFYVLYGNYKQTLRREFSPKRQEFARTDVEVVKDFAMDIFYEDLLNGTDYITFVRVMKEPFNEVIFSIEGRASSPKIYKNKKYFKTL